MAQALAKHLHFTLGDQLHTSIYTIDDWHDDVNNLNRACTWAIWTTVPFNSPHNPSQLAFGMDMIFRKHMKINW